MQMPLRRGKLHMQVQLGDDERASDLVAAHNFRIDTTQRDRQGHSERLARAQPAPHRAPSAPHSGPSGALSTTRRVLYLRRAESFDSVVRCTPAAGPTCGHYRDVCGTMCSRKARTTGGASRLRRVMAVKVIG